MRCPKCGYISFDNVESCRKCKKKAVAKVAEQFQGSVAYIAAPAFLRFGEVEEEDGPAVGDIDVTDEELEIVDPDLDVLLEEEAEADEGIQLSLEDEEGETARLEGLSDELAEIESFEEETRAEPDLDVDLGMFEDETPEEPAQAAEAEVPEAAMEQAPELEVPEELADLSDLSAPSGRDEPDLDLSLDEAAAAVAAEPAAEKRKQREEELDMDEDLDFELDLGGLSIHDDK